VVSPFQKTWADRSSVASRHDGGGVPRHDAEAAAEVGEAPVELAEVGEKQPSAMVAGSRQQHRVQHEQRADREPGVHGAGPGRVVAQAQIATEPHDVRWVQRRVLATVHS